MVLIKTLETSILQEESKTKKNVYGPQVMVQKLTWIYISFM